MSRVILSALLLSLGTWALAMPAIALDAREKTDCTPIGSIDLSSFNLQLPIGEPGHMTTITPAKLDCYSNPDLFFYSTADAALVFKVPGAPDATGCVTSKNSKHCRTELREVSPAKSWDPKNEVNRLKAKLAVVQADNSKWGTVVGQIHVDDDVSNKPVCELFYNANGDVTMGVEQIPDESSLEYTKVGHVDLGKTFEYEIRYEKGELSVSIDGGNFITLNTGSLNAPLSYFKVGNYNQGTGNAASEVHFFDIKIEH
jgi:hypothetical protein